MRKVMEAVKNSHLRGFAILNIRLENVFLDANFQPKIFGLEHSISTKFGVRKGKAGPEDLLAPEMIAKGIYYPAKVDSYHCGILLFEILTMCIKPFEKMATKDDAIFKYIFLDRCDLF